MAEVKLDTAEKTAKKETVSNKTVTYRCVNKCYWNGKLYYVDDTIVVEAKTKVPEHFVVVK